MSTPERTSKKPSRKRATTTDTKPQIGRMTSSILPWRRGGSWMK